MFKLTDFLSSLSRHNLGGLSPSTGGNAPYPGADEANPAEHEPDGDGDDSMSPLPVENTSKLRTLR